MAEIPDDRVIPHPNFDEWTPAEIQAHKKKLEEKISAGSKNGTDRFLIQWWLIERKTAEAELSRRNGNAAPGLQQEFWPEPLTAQQLIDLPADPTRWVWFECLPLHATSALIAREYTGKSTFAASLCLAVARGIEFLGRPTQQGAVLYCYLDGPQDELKENFLSIGIHGGDPIFTYAGRKPDRAIDWIREQCVKRDVRLLIVDTAQKFFGFKEDKYEEKINKMQPMLDLVADYNFHAMFTYHAAKNTANTVSALGSVASEANARVSLYLRRLSDSEDRVFDTQQNAGKRFDAIGLSNPKDGFITKIGSLFDVEVRAMAKHILEVIKDNPGIVEVDIKNQVEGRGYMKGTALRRLLDDGHVERTGTGKRGDARKYYLTGSILSGGPSPKVIDLFPK